MSIAEKNNGLEIRAVQAAESSAVHAERAVDMSYISTVLSILAFIALLVTIIQGRCALKKAENANKIASDTAEKQLRAYLSVEPQGVTIPEKGWMAVPINIINYGATPASEIGIAGSVAVVIGDPRDFIPKELDALEDNVLVSETFIGPNSNRYHQVKQPDEFLQEHMNDIGESKAAIVHYGWVTYMDVFGKKHRTNFAFYHRGEELSDVASMRCRFGNSAT